MELKLDKIMGLIIFSHILLIVPYGIETQPRKVELVILIYSFNRTLWN